MKDSKNIDVSRFYPEDSQQLTGTVGKSGADDEASTVKRVSSKQRKASLDEYRETFMIAPKIIDRQPVFVSRHTRDSIDSIVRRLGERKMSVSGFLENLPVTTLNSMPTIWSNGNDCNDPKSKSSQPAE